MTVAVAGRSAPVRNNPLDIVEELVSGHDWDFERSTDDELVARVTGRWGDYQLFFAWHVELAALQLSCALDIKVPELKRRAVTELLALINEHLWAGHFEMSVEHAAPTFRHTILLRGASGASAEQVEDLVDIAVTESDRFYPAFQFVIWGGKSASDAIIASLIDTVAQA